MYPRLLEIGPLTIYSYGLMVAIAFITASYLLSHELRRRNMNRDVTNSFLSLARWLYGTVAVGSVILYVWEHGGLPAGVLFESMLGVFILVAAVGLGYFLFGKRTKAAFDLTTSVTLLAVVCGMIGAKVFHVLENRAAFVAAPFSTVFSPGGLTFLGGFLLATAVIYILTRKARVSFLSLGDAASPGLALGYGIARIGCHLAGDGDYGLPTTLPWGTIYARGTYKPSVALADYFERNPEAAARWRYEELSSEVVTTDDFGRVTQFDLQTALHPTPIYELLIGIVIFIVLWRLRRNNHAAGKLFMIYLLLTGAARFTIEYIRLNPQLFLGFSEAQLISLGLMVVGAYGIWRLSRKQPIGTRNSGKSSEAKRGP